MSQFKSGIYKITINDCYIYIGQSVDIKSRWRQHLNELKRNKHCNKKLQNVYNKHSDTIKFKIIEYCDVDKLDEREMYWIGYYRSFNTKHGLNMGIGGGSNRKHKTKEEAEQAIKEYRIQYRMQYYKNNKDELKEYTSRWYINNKERLLSYAKQYQQQHREEIRRKRGILSHSKRHKLQFETRYKCSRPLTDREWDIWRNTKYKSRLHATKFLKTLPNLTFTIPPPKK